MAALSIQNISYSHGSTKVLDSLSLTLEKGEFVTLLGANGTGKSTLARILSCLVPVDSGSLQMEGKPLQRGMVGMVTQNPDNQIVGETVEEDVAFGPENLGLPVEEIERRIGNALKQCGAEVLRYRSTRSLSGGEKQKVAVASMLALEQDILILDEATSMLDKEGRKTLLETILRLKAQGKTILLITHHPEECLLSDRTLILGQGHILKEGKPEDLLKDKVLLRENGLRSTVSGELSFLLQEEIPEFPVLLTEEEWEGIL